LRGRDLAVVLAVVLIGGFAVADALRGRAEQAQSTTTAPRREEGPRPQPEAPPGWPKGILAGTLVFTDAEDCRVRVVGLADGRERPVGSVVGDCRLWAAPRTQRIAYGTGSGSFRFVDLLQADRPLGQFDGLIGSVLWTSDGRRAAWCTARQAGLEFQVEELIVGRLRSCPIAYAPDGEPAFAPGSTLVAGGHTVLRAGERIMSAHWGTDGSLGLVAGGRFERWEGKRPVDAIDIPDRLRRWPPVPSPNNCAVVLRDVDGETLEIRPVGCFRPQNPALLIFGGHAATWSPDGRWIAVAERASIAFHRIAGPPMTIHWPARAAEVAWRLG
jgi:hypothetical protein